jgi:hypothetical protein
VPAQKQDDKHDDRDEDKCSDADIRGVAPVVSAGLSPRCLIRFSRPAGEGWLTRGRIAGTAPGTGGLSYLVTASLAFSAALLSAAMASAAVGRDPGHPDDHRGDRDNQPK